MIKAIREELKSLLTSLRKVTEAYPERLGICEAVLTGSIKENRK